MVWENCGLISTDLSNRSYVINSLSVVTKFSIALKATEFKTTPRKQLIQKIMTLWDAKKVSFKL